MKRLSVICKRWEVVVVPFPFSEKPTTKRRPALVLSTEEFNNGGHTILAMITTRGHQPWPADTEIEDFKTAGLRLPCVVRFKIFTLDNKLILRKIGHLSEADSRKIEQHIRLYLT
jgi:mRNA interferase MazF